MKSDDAKLTGLIEQLQNGDATAFAHLVTLYRDAVCAITFHYLQNREDAQDAAQETFIQAYQHLSELREASRFALWLRRMAVNQCQDRLRRRKRDSLALPRLAPSENPVNLHDLGDLVGRRLFVHHALAQLSPKLRLTFTLCYIGEYAHEEIARFLEVPVGTVRSRLRLAKQQLRQEMETMAIEALEDIRPDGEWTRKVVEAAIQRGKAALKRHERGEAVRAFDEALAALEKAEPVRQIQQWTLDVLRQKDIATAFSLDRDARRTLLAQAHATARALGDRQAEAELLQNMGRTSRTRAETAACYEQALTLFRELGDVSHQAECLLLLGMDALFEGNAETSKAYIAEANALFEQAGTKDWRTVCIALQELLAESEAIGLDRLLLWSGMGDGLDIDNGKVRFGNQPGFQLRRSIDEHPAALSFNSVFWQLSALRTFLDSNVPVGGEWSGIVSSFSCQPLRASLRVVRADETVIVPAGTFTDCLLTELVTTETDAPDYADEPRKELNRSVLCGCRRAWYAPSVGLIRLQITPAEGQEVEIHLQTYDVGDGDTDYLPLALGNTWTYGWTGIPETYVAWESYRVTAHSENRWHLAHWGLAYIREA